MAKFCKNCGNQMDDDATFCGSCGNKVENPTQEQTATENVCECENCNSCDQTEAPSKANIGDMVNKYIGKLKNKDKNTLIITGAVAGVVIILLVLALVLGGGNSPEAALETYIDVMFNEDASAIEDLAPKGYWEYVEDENDVELKDAEKAAEAVSKLAIRGLEDEYGDDISVKFKVTDTDEVSKSDLSEMKDNIKESYDIPKKSVEDAVEIEAEMTVKGDDDEDTDEATFYAVKIDGDWYLCYESGKLYVEEFVSVAGVDMDDLGDLLK